MSHGSLLPLSLLTCRLVGAGKLLPPLPHYIAGVLDRESMAGIVESLCERAPFQPGDRVKTLRGSTLGVILRLLDDGRVVWQPDGSRSELTALPKSLVRAQNKT